MTRTPPQGDLRDHDHSRAGEGGDQLDPDSVGLEGDEPFDFGDIQLEFRPDVGTSGALVFRDTATGEDRFFIEVGDVARFASQALRMPDGLKMFFGGDQDVSMAFEPAVGANGAVVFRDEANDQDRLELRVGEVFRLLGQGLDVNGQDIEDDGTTIWDSADGEVPNPQVEGLANFAADQLFSGYPIGLDDDTDLDAGGSGLTGLASINGGITGNNLLSDITGTNLSISGGVLNAAAGTVLASQTDDLSDATLNATRANQADESVNLVNITSGGVAFNGALQSQQDSTVFEITIDGGATLTPGWLTTDHGYTSSAYYPISNIDFDTSLTITLTSDGAGNNIWGQLWTKT